MPEMIDGIAGSKERWFKVVPEFRIPNYGIAYHGDSVCE
jgi:hypothetical protein